VRLAGAGPAAQPAGAPAGTHRYRPRARRRIELGGRELAAPQLDARHLRLRRDAQGHWWAASATAQARCASSATAAAPAAVRSRSAPAQQFQLGAAHYTVDAIDGNGVRFSDGAARLAYDGATVWRDGAALGACPGAGPGARLLGLWNRWLPAA
jgi:cell division protein FtsW